MEKTGKSRRIEAAFSLVGLLIVILLVLLYGKLEPATTKGQTLFYMLVGALFMLWLRRARE